jgi:protoporphyrin/coproporphyrin ferrochelatase
MSAGILLVNLGSPDSPSVGDVRRYLREFLMDGRVIDTPWPLRTAIVYGGILPFRPKESAHAYRSVWTTEGPPLIATCRRVHAQLQERTGIPVELAMRYQNPSIEDALGKLADQNVEQLLLIPMFPHYAMSSYETAVERVKKLLVQHAPQMTLTVQPPYYDAPDYISALTASAKSYLSDGYDHLLFSFHGVPERQIKKSDPTGCHCLKAGNCCEAPSPAHATCYRAQCFKTVKAFVRQADIPATKYSVAFQSRLGRDPWLAPSTEDELRRLAFPGVKKLLVICPAFVADCLETIEEIGIRGRKTFLDAGGKDFVRIPCLNEHSLWLAALENMASRFLRSTGLETIRSRASMRDPVACCSAKKI